MIEYKHKTTPYSHQRKVFEISRDEEAFALLMDMGTGKSKVIIDTAAWQYARGNIDALILIAPNGVHRNWIEIEIPRHLPDWVTYRATTWASSMRKAESRALDDTLEVGYDGLRIIAMNVEALSHKNPVKFLRYLLRVFRCMLVLDESSRIKTPGANRTKALLSSSQDACFRRILSGTPITQGPLDLWAQFKFLDPEILGHSTFASFRAHYAVLKDAADPLVRSIMAKGSMRFAPAIIDGYKNLEELRGRIAPYSFQVKKSDCLDLPDKIYESRPVDLGKKQRAIYDRVLKQVLVELGASDGTEDALWSLLIDPDTYTIRSQNGLTRLLRLQQVIGGFVTTENNLGEKQTEVIEDNKRLNVMLEVIEETSGKIIVWARFRPELEAITEKLGAVYGLQTVREYHGGVDTQTRALAVDSFQQDQDVRFFVAQPHCGGIGLTLTAANTVIYYSNDFSYETRAQSEDRCHRIGQTNKVTYVDLVAPSTVDQRILDALATKREMANSVLSPLLGTAG